MADFVYKKPQGIHPNLFSKFGHAIGVKLGGSSSLTSSRDTFTIHCDMSGAAIDRAVKDAGLEVLGETIDRA